MIPTNEVTFIIIVEINETKLLFNYCRSHRIGFGATILYHFVQQIRLMIQHAAFLLFGRAHLIVGTFFIIIVKILMVKIEQIKLMIADMIEKIRSALAHVHANNNHKNKNSNLSATSLVKSLHQISPLTKQLQFHYTHIIITLTHLNFDFVAPIFFAFMIITAPLNCILVYALIFNDVPSIAAIIVLAAVSQQVTGHFWIHLSLSKLNHQIISPLKSFRSLTTMIGYIIQLKVNNNNNPLQEQKEHSQKTMKLSLVVDLGSLTTTNKYSDYPTIRDRIQWHCFLCDYINNRSYGFTYHKFGRISMSSFVKVIVHLFTLSIISLPFCLKLIFVPHSTCFYIRKY